MSLFSWFTKSKGATGRPKLLCEMNIPANLARMSAAYAKFSGILTKDIFRLDDDKRADIYQEAVVLLDTAIDTCLSSAVQLKHGRQSPDTLLQYFKILRDTVRTIGALVDRETSLIAEEKQLSEFIGSNVIPRFIAAEEVFSANEVSLMHFAWNLIELASPAIQRHVDKAKKVFDERERGRFDKAFAEYSVLYKDWDWRSRRKKG